MLLSFGNSLPIFDVLVSRRKVSRRKKKRKNNLMITDYPKAVPEHLGKKYHSSAVLGHLPSQDPGINWDRRQRQ